MKKRNIKLKCASLAIAVCIFLTACSKEKESALKMYILPESISVADSGIVADNERLVMNWDTDQHCLYVSDKQTGKIWSSTPFDYYKSGDRTNDYTASGLCSSLYATYVNSEGLEQELNSYSDASYIQSVKIKNGIKLTYFFDEVQISIPVEYVLNSDGISASIDTSGITEGKNKLYAVEILPFFASVKNDSENMLFVPSGCGALMRADSGIRNVRTYSEPVYGEDAAFEKTYKTVNTESVHMPVFGIPGNKSGVLGIITSGEETAYIKATAGDEQYGNSAVWAQFRLRSKAIALVKDINNLNATVGKYTDGIVNIGKPTVRYIFTSARQSGYMGLVNAYRNYLENEQGVRKCVSETNVMINVLGGAKEKKFFLGVPYYSTAALTSYREASEIISDITENDGVKAAVQLKGFGATGIDTGKIASGFKLSGIYGSKSDFNALSKLLSEKHGNLFIDYDVVRYISSGGGYSIRKAAKNATDTISVNYGYDIVTHSKKTEYGGYRLLGRYYLARVGSRLADAAKKYPDCDVGLSTLSNYCYSDNSDALYYAGAHMSDDVERIFDTVAKGKKKIMSDNANIYAAVKSECVINSPTESSGYNYFDEEIPFYQMVLRGYTSLSGGIINLSPDAENEYLKTISTGSALGFTLTYREPVLQVKQAHPELGRTVYGGLKENINSMISKALPLLKRTSGCEIVSYKKENNVTETVFDNGTVLYVNFGEGEAHTPLGTVMPYSFIYN